MTNITSMTIPTEAMKAGAITAKLRDAVHVSFMVNGDEVIWYKNIEIPKGLKEYPVSRFGFHILAGGKLEFQLHFEEGVLPKEFPAKRERQHRKPKGEVAPAFAKGAALESKTASIAQHTETNPAKTIGDTQKSTSTKAKAK